MSFDDSPTRRERLPPRVLVVDDEPIMRKGIARTLQHFGYATVTAADGAQALARYAEWRPDVVLVDLHLPDMDGHELIARLNAQSGVAPPMIVVTGDNRRSQVEGARLVVMKPFSPTGLVEVVEAHTRRPCREPSRL